MSLIPKTTCRRCNNQYAAIRGRCPHCGTKRVQPTERAAATAAAASPGTASNARASSNTSWQMVFGLILLAAVVIAVIALVSATINARHKAQEPSPTPTMENTPTPTPPPTPTPAPTPTVTAVTITFLGAPLVKDQFLFYVGQTIDLDATIYPLDAEATVKWSSGDESVMTVDQNGVCTAVSPGTTKVYAECGAARSEGTVYVK